jgi:hypothetical protein
MMPNLRVGAVHDPLVGAAEAAAAKRERRTVVSCMVMVVEKVLIGMVRIRIGGEY